MIIAKFTGEKIESICDAVRVIDNTGGCPHKTDEAKVAFDAAIAELESVEFEKEPEEGQETIEVAFSEKQIEKIKNAVSVIKNMNLDDLLTDGNKQSDWGGATTELETLSYKLDEAFEESFD